jgi:hypothetical protein
LFLLINSFHGAETIATGNASPRTLLELKQFKTEYGVPNIAGVLDLCQEARDSSAAL